MNGIQQIFISIAFIATLLFSVSVHAQLKGGVGKMDITDYKVFTNDPLYVKALALDDGTTKIVIITLDVVAIEEIGPIKNGYLEKVRSQIQKELNLSSTNKCNRLKSPSGRSEAKA